MHCLSAVFINKHQDAKGTVLHHEKDIEELFLDFLLYFSVGILDEA